MNRTIKITINTGSEKTTYKGVPLSVAQEMGLIAVNGVRGSSILANVALSITVPGVSEGKRTIKDLPEAGPNACAWSVIDGQPTIDVWLKSNSTTDNLTVEHIATVERSWELLWRVFNGRD